MQNIIYLLLRRMRLPLITIILVYAVSILGLVLVPGLAFDRRGRRLGYGGGYYDRTLAALRPKPVTIGVGYEHGRLPTIYPQWHDVPLDAIVTEKGFSRTGDGDGFASSPCMLQDFDET